MTNIIIIISKSNAHVIIIQVLNKIKKRGKAWAGMTYPDCTQHVFFTREHIYDKKISCYTYYNVYNVFSLNNCLFVMFWYYFERKIFCFDVFLIDIMDNGLVSDVPQTLVHNRMDLMDFGWYYGIIIKYYFRYVM